MRRILLIHIIVLCPPFVNAQVAQAGKVESYTNLPDGIRGKGKGYIFEVNAWSDQIFRIRVTKNQDFKPLEYALQNTAAPGHKATVEDSGNAIRISTDAMTAIIQKEPSFKITFVNDDGDVISQDADTYDYGVTFLGERVSIYKKLQEGERFIGMGEALGNLDRRASGITLNNTDNYKYGDPRIPMYVSIPFYMGIHQGQIYGMFINNSHRSFFNFGLSTPRYASVTMEGGDADYFFMYDASVEKIIGHYTSLTGRMPLPPLWSLGYHQSRCSYYPQDQVEWIAETFRRKRIPIDGIVLDADYQKEYMPFRTDTNRFPDMPVLARKLAGMQIGLTASVYPGVQLDTTYASYREGIVQ